MAGNPGVGVVVVGRSCSGSLGGGNLVEGRRKTVPPRSAEIRPIPLIEGIDMAWSLMGDVSALPHVEGKKVFRDLTHRMFNGTDGAGRLYGIRPPLQSPALITNAHEYQFQEDGSAKHLFNEDDRVVDLHVHRAEVKR